MIDNGGDDGVCGGVVDAIKLLIDVMRKGRRSKNEKKKVVVVVACCRVCVVYLKCLVCTFLALLL